MRSNRALAALLALLGSLSTGRLAAQEGGEGGTPPAKEEGAEDDAKKKDDEKDAKYFAIVGGDVYTGTGAIFRGATVLARNGKITEIGYDVVLPEGTKTLDAQGLRVYPGLIALGATSRVSAGLMAVEGPEEHAAEEEPLEPAIEILLDGLLPLPLSARDTHVGAAGPAVEPEDEGPFQAEEEGEEKKSEIEDTFDPFNSFLVLALATGITTAQQSSAAVKLKRYEIEGVLLGDRHLAAIPWDVGNPSGIKATRDKFAKAAEYPRAMRTWRERNDKDQKEPTRKGVDTTANRVLSGEALAYFRASQREELLGIARFAQEYGFRPVIEGCEEGWTVADELGRAGAYAVLTPRRRMPKDERFVRPGGASIENAALLHKSGVQVAVRPDSTTIDFIGTAGRDLLHLPVEAGFAVRGGLPDEAALAAMTIVPARVLGIDHRVGSLAPGKDCDAIVTDGDILHYQTFVQYAVVDGKLVYDKEEELYFAHIRPRPKKPQAAAAEEPEAGKKAEEGSESEEKQEEAKEESSGEEEKTDDKKDDEKKDDKKDE
jgi:imidazolonepropionase-like amidohydrolase